MTASSDATSVAAVIETVKENPFVTTDVDNASLFAARWKSWLLYDGKRKQWLLFDKKWSPCTDSQVMRLARDLTYEWSTYANRTITAKNVVAYDDAWQHIYKTRMRPRLLAMVALAQLDLHTTPTHFDTQPYLLNCQNGTIDFEKVEFRPHSASDRITKITNVDYEEKADAPRWERFLREIFLTAPGGSADENLIAYMQRFVGYCVTGDVSEDTFAILYGEGFNGKSTFITTIRNVLGDYAQSCAPELLIEARRQNGSSASPDVARLCGARLVTAAELPPGRLNTKLVKALTGGDAVTARPLYGEPFEFLLTAKFIVCTNHKPVVPESTIAIWRRLKLVPFYANFEHAITLDRKLRRSLSDDEGPGILRWIVEGVLQWRKHGLGSSDSVVKVTQSYRAEQNVYARFIDGACVIGEGAQVRGSWLYEAFKKWADGREEAVSAKRFHAEMRRWYTVKTVKGHETYRGIALSDDAARMLKVAGVANVTHP